MDGWMDSVCVCVYVCVESTEAQMYYYLGEAQHRSTVMQTRSDLDVCFFVGG